MGVISTSNFPPFGIACMLCNDSLIAPNLSEYVSERHVRHSWSCESCDHQFETSECLRFEAMSISPHPLLPERWGLGVVPKIVAAEVPGPMSPVLRN